MDEIYIGTKIIKASPMDERTFIWMVKHHQSDPNMETRPGYKVTYEDGYVSWSPKETFERAYRKLSGGEMNLFFPRDCNPECEQG